jgi:hypothetical protein
MRQRTRSRSVVPLLCMLWGFALGSCQPTAMGPTMPSGYRIELPRASQALRSHPLALTVRVSDTAGKPVDEVLVHFRVPDAWATRAQVDPPTVATRQGQATTTFRARATGQLMVHITVEDRTADIPITVVGETPQF